MAGPNPAELEALLQLLGIGPLGGLVGGSGVGGKVGRIGQSLLGSDVVKAILVWQVAGQVVGPLLLPFMTEVEQEAFDAARTRVLSAADAADAYIRGHLSEQEARDHIHKQGFTDELASVMFSNAGNPPPLGTLLEAYRRGLIPMDGRGSDSLSVEQGIREGRTHDKWIPILEKLVYALPTPADALRAALEGQVDMATARELFSKWGGNPDYFQLLFDTEGSAPTPMEAADMARRGIIPWDGEGPEAVSFHQAFLEGPWRNKWEPAFRQLAVYRPPVRSVVAMLRSGAITDERATFLLKQQGADDQTIAEMLAEAHHSKTQTARDLTTAQVLDAYALKLVDQATATAMLAKLGWTPENAATLLAERDVRQARAQLDSAVTRTRTLYIGHKISEEEARKALAAYQLPQATADSYLLTWSLERRANVKTLTVAEVAWAFGQGLLSEADALTEIEGEGYSPRDAWIVLAHHSKQTPTSPMPAETSPGDELAPAR